MVTRHIEDLNLGDWITVLSWNDSEALVCPGCDTVLATPRTQWIGKPLKIVAVDIPFVVVEYNLGGLVTDPLDLRRCRIQRCSDEYLLALGKTPGVRP